MTEEIAVIQQTTMTMQEMTPSDVVRQVTLIHDVMKKAMKDKEHFGIIPGTSKPTLYKAGAEKLLLTFRLAPEYEEVGITEEDDLISYRIRCRLLHITTGAFVGSGLGACNSREKKYLKSSPRDIQNTLYKMACKRALVAAVLNATAASDIFTQDLEDMDTIPNGTTNQTSKNGANPTTASEKKPDPFFACPSGKLKGVEWSKMKKDTREWYKTHYEKQLKDPAKQQYYNEYKIMIDGINSVVEVESFPEGEVAQ